VTARHVFPVVVAEARRRPRHRPPLSVLAVPLRQSFEELGGTFVKFGQLVASSPGVFGDETAEAFRTCLDTGPAVPFAAVRAVVEEDLGMALEDAFATFDPDPIGRASIAVVHRATLPDGRPVAVKILRPGIESLVAVDLALLQPLLELVARETGDEAAGVLTQIFLGFRDQVGEELDLRNEARALAAFRDLLARSDLPGGPLSRLVVPELFPERSGRAVVTMELLDGVPIDDPAGAAALGVDPAPLIEEVVRSFFVTAVRWGAFHGDVHAGNMLLLRDGRLGIVDWGIVGRLDAETHRFFVRVLDGVLGDEGAWRDVADHMVTTYGPAMQQGLGLSDDELAQFIRSLVEPTLLRPFGEVSLGALIQAPQLQAARAEGIDAGARSLRASLGRLRAKRRLRRLADQSGGTASAFDRGAFLLGKQLLYFERYGKLFLADVPLLADRPFFEAVAASAPRAEWAASQPHMPCTPPPGGTDDEHRKTPGNGVR
jgi:predicted unusual protein kinase regulating ubiquinone biosynthesis (AarF/ABC1/UbiB family)